MAAWIDHLNENSAAIQAVSTIVLVLITGWYAKLTRDLSRTAHDQLEESKATRKAQEKERSAVLKELLLRMNERLAQIPEDDYPKQQDIQSLLDEYDKYRLDLTRSSSLEQQELGGHIDKILHALSSLKEVTRGVRALTGDQAVASARLPVLTLKECCADALKYLSQDQPK
ncbi:MAG: hypothetical protein KJZ58_00525 [Flavobacteriales bacterium]|nr:hypothetical protein [Flavobacteriales bacterium]